MDRKRFIGLILLLFQLAIVFGIRTVRGQADPITVDPRKTHGSETAPITLTLFSDFGCPYCRKITPVVKKLEEAYPTELRVVFKQFPLWTHERSQPAAQAAECAADQNKFWDYHDKLFTNAREWYFADPPNNDLFYKYAKDIGLDENAFKTCLDSGVKKEVIQKDIEEGRKAFVSGTPTLLINGWKVVTKYDFDSIKADIQKQLNELTKS